MSEEMKTSVWVKIVVLWLFVGFLLIGFYTSAVGLQALDRIEKRECMQCCQGEEDLFDYPGTMERLIWASAFAVEYQSQEGFWDANGVSREVDVGKCMWTADKAWKAYRKLMSEKNGSY